MSFRFEGAPVAAREGDTVAAALERAGLRPLRRTTQRSGGEDRGLFCGMGVCHECLVEIDGRAAQRACMTPAAGVLEVRRHRDGEPAPLERLAPAPKGGAMPVVEADLAIVGAGPAGMAAALAADGAGLSVLLLDERGKAGGQYFKAPGPETRLDAQHRRGEALRRALAASGVDHRRGHIVWHAARRNEGFELGVLGDGAALLVVARAVILATGAYERPAMVPGWTLPGVMTVGGAQGFVRSHGFAPGKAVLVAGNGPLCLQLAAEMTRAGTPPVAVLERAVLAAPSKAGALAAMATKSPSLVMDGLKARLILLRAGVPVLEGWEVMRCEGEAALAAVVARRIATGAERRFGVDTLATGEGFWPQLELARALGCPAEWIPARGHFEPLREADGRTSVPGVWIAGDGGGLGGAHAALAQGRLAGAAARDFLGAAPLAPTSLAKDRRTLDTARAFQKALWSLYGAPPRQSDTEDRVVCRCETVRRSDIDRAVAAGAEDIGALKRMTRLGMGRCQGRYCTSVALTLFDEPALFAPQSPVRPVPAAALAIEKPEWGGHRRADTPTLRPPEHHPGPLPPRCDLLVVGAGIMGTAAALEATALGLDTLVVDRGPVNAESSGGNAGSLHLQLLSFDFGAKTGGRGSALLETLSLQRDAIALWHELENGLGADFEIVITGGMMLAEEEGHIGFLRDKIAAERSVGIEVELIGRDEIARLAPHVSEKMIAAAWCPGEGKINPLLGTPALAGAARASGARFAHGVAVAGIERDGDGFLVSTNRGSIRAGRLILAAGAWTGGLSGLLGTPLPITGAPLQMVVTETAPPLAPCLLAHADRHLTMKQAGAGNLIIGGAWPAALDPRSGRAHVLRESLEGNLWVAERVLPALAGLHVLRSWAAMNVDIDGAPVVGPLPSDPRCVVVAGANGYTLGPLLGRIAARTVASGRLDPAYGRFSPDRLIS